MKRVLVFGMTENPGGIESFLMSYCRRMDPAKLRFDFLCNCAEPVAYEQELRAMGARIYRVPARSRDYFGYRRAMHAFFAQHAAEYAAIWVNVCSLANIDYLLLAEKYGIPRRIIHSHNSQNMDSRLRGLLHRRNRRRIGRCATDFWACSPAAAAWFYPPALLPQAVTIRNAIDVERVRFDPAARQRLRQQYGFGSRPVVGHVGRLHFQKNQRFLLEVFAGVRQRCPEAVLVLIGQGEDEEKLRQKAAELQIADAVLFAGVQSHVPAWLSAFDLFLFPSLFEGLSIAALEAQGSGLPVLASEGVIPPEVRLNDNFRFYPLAAGASAWAEEACAMLRETGRVPFPAVRAAFAAAGFDNAVEAAKLEDRLMSE